MPKPLPYPRPARFREFLGSLLMSLVLLGCAQWRKPSGPIPEKLILAPQPGPARPLVIVLPGRYDTLDDLDHSGIGAAVQQTWPAADVLLAGATLDYYAEGRLAERLHDEIVLPARQRGYRQIWLTGASMGGLGALLYERRYPHDVTGLVLYAPYMGEPALIRKIAAAGGPAHWDPGPPPAAVDADNYETEIWRVVKGWWEPAEAKRVWLACGDRDRFIASCRTLATMLPADHYIELRGGHDWPIWTAAAGEIFRRIAASH